MKSIPHFILNLPLRRKIQAVILLAAALLTAVAFLGSFAVQRVNENLLYNAVADSLGYSVGELCDTLETAENLSYLILSDQALQNSLVLVKTEDDPYHYRGEYQQIYERLSSYQFQFRNTGFVSNLSIYNDRYASHVFSTRALPETVSQALCRIAEEAAGRPVWVTEFSDAFGLFLVRELRRADDFSFKNLGVLVVHIDTQELVPHAFRFLSGQETLAVLSDEAHTLYSAPALLQEGTVLPQSLSHRRYEILSLGSGSYFTVQKKLPGYGWTLTALLSFDSIRDTLARARLLYGGAVLAAFLLSLLLSALLARSLTAHFQFLIEKMHRFAQDSTAPVQSPYDYSGRTDEIAVLHQQFDQMAEQTRTLIEQNYVSELLRRDAQLKALQMQINPHFLYNTLESLNWRAKTAGQTEISQMAEALGRVLRASLDRRQEDFTLGRELELVNSYMTIQQLRFEDRLQYAAAVAPELLPARLPRLTLQPLTENAIHYALEENPDDCRIEITAEHFGEQLHIFVRNTGSFFEEDFTERFQNGTLETHGLGVGLQNINDRLRLTFGKAYGLSFFNEDDFAVVQISVPFEIPERGGTPC